MPKIFKPVYLKKPFLYRFARWIDRRMPRLLAIAAGAAILTLVCGIALFSWVFLPDRRNTATVSIPDLVGEEYAPGELENIFRVIIEYEYSATAPEGTVIAQYPPAGATRKINPAGRASTLTLTVSRGDGSSSGSPSGSEHYLVVPELVGLSESYAHALLQNLGLSVGGSRYQTSPVAAGEVIGQSLPKGTTVLPGTEIFLTVSLG